MFHHHSITQAVIFPASNNNFGSKVNVTRCRFLFQVPISVAVIHCRTKLHTKPPSHLAQAHSPTPCFCILGRRMRGHMQLPGEAHVMEDRNFHKVSVKAQYHLRPGLQTSLLSLLPMFHRPGKPHEWGRTSTPF